MAVKARSDAIIVSVPTKDAVVAMGILKEILKDHGPIGAAIFKFVHRARDIEECLVAFEPLASERQAVVKSSIESVVSAVSKLNDAGRGEQWAGQFEVAIRKIGRALGSNLPEALRRSLFTGLFAAFDAFTGDLIAAIYAKRPEILKSLEGSVSVAEALSFASYDELRCALVDKEIESLRRESYIKQFETLERRFGLELRKFKNWAKFVECSQHRNLLMHCDGVVTAQYIDACKKVGHMLGPEVVLGHPRPLATSDVISACEVLTEVAFKLGQTLWRKVFPEESESADIHLHSMSYESLALELWDRAIMIGQFACGLSKMNNEMAHRIAVINLAIALKFGGQPKVADELLARFDWSAAHKTLQLAHWVLKDDFRRAADLVAEIGTATDFPHVTDYHRWPLFREFRKSKEFRVVWKNVLAPKTKKHTKSGRGKNRRQEPPPTPAPTPLARKKPR